MFPRFLLSLFLVFAACTDSDDDNSFPPSENDNDSSEFEGQAFSSDCGVVQSGQANTEIDSSTARIGSAEVAGPNRIIFRSNSGEFLIKLHGIDDFSGIQSDAAMDRIEELLSGEMYFFEAVPECTATASNSGGQAFVGSVYNSSGINLGEDLISSGLVPSVDQNDECSGNLIGACLEALREASLEDGEPASNFLWKPESERDGNVAILFSPSASAVFANGEACTVTGPSNGRATTARCGKTGCAYGSNVRVSALDDFGRPILFQGSTEFIVADGCDRVEF